jgi:four helix bundle protein
MNPTLVSDHRSLKVWQKAMELAHCAYSVTKRFPAPERYGLTAQLRRSAVSVPANIAEGNGRLHRREYIYHLSVARGSLREVSTLLELSKRFGYLGEAEVATAEDLIDHTGRMLTLLIKSLQRKPVR